MPRLSDSMEEGTILAWMKAVGDEVAVGDELVEIETDKANMVYESDVAGTLTEIIAEEGATLPIGEVIAKVGDASEVSSGGSENGAGAKPEEEPAGGGDGTDAADAKSESADQPVERPGVGAPAPDEGRSTQAEPTSTGGERIKASPIARRIAADRGVDLASLRGSGPGGRIIKRDVEEAPAGGSAPAATEPAATAETPAAPVKAAPTPGASEKPETARGTTEAVELTKLQQTVARRMAESKATAPHFYLTTEVDMSRAVEARKRIKAAASTRATSSRPSTTWSSRPARSRCASSAREWRLQRRSRRGALRVVGAAVAAQDALVVPTVFDADTKGLRQIATETRALAARVRDGSITLPELSGGTFTVSNLGMYGVTSFSAVINPPQAGILAVGSIEEVPVVRDGEIMPGSKMSVTLACDHRILYGADGAEFLARVRDLLTEPVFLAL